MPYAEYGANRSTSTPSCKQESSAQGADRDVFGMLLTGSIRRFVAKRRSGATLRARNDDNGPFLAGPSSTSIRCIQFEILKSFRVDSHLHVQLADTGADSVDMHVLTATKHGCFLQELHYVLCFLGACLSLLWLLSCARVDGSSHS